MDDLDALREFRSDHPPLDPETEARIRVRALGERPSTADTIPRIEFHDLADLADPGESPTRPRPRLLVAGVAAVALVCVIAAAVYGLGQAPKDEVGPSSPSTVSPSKVSIAAGAQPDRPLRPGEYVFTRVVEGSDDGGKPGSEMTIEAWVNTDGVGWESRQPAAESGGGPPATRIPVDPQRGGRFGALTYAQVRDLPTTPDAAVSALLRDTHLSEDEVDQFGDAAQRLLAWPVVPPATRRALIEALIARGQPVGTIVGHDGREGFGLSVPAPGGARTVFVFDPATGALFGTFTVPPGAPLEAGQATRWFTVTESGIRDRLPA